jgi:predicted enzyme related to lactoylglutathione lyase
VLQIHHVVVYVSDMDRAIDFYINTLKLYLRFKSEHWSEVGSEKTNVYIGLHNTKDANIPSGDTIDISFKVDNIKYAREELESRGVQFYDNITEISPTSWYTSFKDPDGNCLSIYRGE